MADKTMDKQLLNYFHSLPSPEQTKVLKYLKSLLKKRDLSNENLLNLAGSISSEDIGLMKDAIEKGCEKIDKNEW